MHRKMARPTDSAGKVMWNAAVVANCHRERSMKVCVFIFFRIPWAVQTAGQAQAGRGRGGSGGKIMAGGPGGNAVAPPGPANDHDGGITPVPHPGRRPIRLPASRASGLAVSWGSAEAMIAAWLRPSIMRIRCVRGLADCALNGPTPFAGVRTMSTEKQNEAARHNSEKAREVRSERAHGEDVPRSSEGMTTAEKDRLADAEFAFPEERKEPLSDAAHVRNAIARFDQGEGVTDEERDQAWQRIRAAARKYGVHISEEDWRDLSAGGKDRT